MMQILTPIHQMTLPPVQSTDAKQLPYGYNTYNLAPKGRLFGMRRGDHFFYPARYLKYLEATWQDRKLM
jgi:hypothetical protein